METTTQALKITFSVLGLKFLRLDRAYWFDGGGDKTLEDMAALARVAGILEPAAAVPFKAFVDRVDELLRAKGLCWARVEDAPVSTRFDRVEESMDRARKEASVAFKAYLSPEQIVELGPDPEF